MKLIVRINHVLFSGEIIMREISYNLLMTNSVFRAFHIFLISEGFLWWAQCNIEIMGWSGKQKIFFSCASSLSG